MTDDVKSLAEMKEHLYKAFNHALRNYEWDKSYGSDNTREDMKIMGLLAQATAAVEHESLVQEAVRAYVEGGGNIADLADGLTKDIKALRPMKLK
jgi:hypothetical protein